MAHSKLLTLTTPEEGPTVTELVLAKVELNFESGKAEAVFFRCTAGDAVVGSERHEFTMPGVNLANVENEVLTQAVAAGILPAGTVVDA